MGTVDRALAADLRDRLQLRRAVETGTLHGRTARSLGRVFDEVVTIELSEELHAAVTEVLRPFPHIRVLQGHSVQRLRELADPDLPTLYFLDGHWCGGKSAGVEDECPVLEELEVIAPSHPDDCLIIDDARLFISPPPPPHRPEKWPTLGEVRDELGALHPEHLITVLADQIIAVPLRAEPALKAYSQRMANA
jgi:hypothetical protein